MSVEHMKAAHAVLAFFEHVLKCASSDPVKSAEPLQGPHMQVV